MKYNFNKIIDTLDRLYGEDQKIDKALKGLCEAVCPDMHPVFFGKSCVWGFLEAFKCIDDNIYNDLCYYTYDAKAMDKPVITYNGKKYNAKNKKEFIDYLNIYYNK